MFHKHQAWASEKIFTHSNEKNGSIGKHGKIKYLVVSFSDSLILYQNSLLYYIGRSLEVLSRLPVRETIRKANYPFLYGALYLWMCWPRPEKWCCLCYYTDFSSYKRYKNSVKRTKFTAETRAKGRTGHRFTRDSVRERANKGKNKRAHCNCIIGDARSDFYCGALPLAASLVCYTVPAGVEMGTSISFEDDIVSIRWHGYNLKTSSVWTINLTDWWVQGEIFGSPTEKWIPWIHYMGLSNWHYAVTWRLKKIIGNCHIIGVLR